MKLACFSDTCAVPEAESLETGLLDQPAGRVAGRIGEDRAGVGPPGLMAPAPADDGRELRPFRRGVPGRDRELGLHHHLATPPTDDDGSRSAGGRRRRCPPRRAGDRPRCSGAGSPPCRTRVRRRSSAPLPRPNPARRRPRSGRPTRRRPPGGPGPGSGRGPARAGPRTGLADPGRGIGQAQPDVEPAARGGRPRRRSRRRRPAGSNHGRSRTPATPLPVRAVRTASRSSGPSTSTKSAAGPPTPYVVSGPRGWWRVARSAQGGRQRVVEVARSGARPHHAGDSNSSSGSVVRSPAPRVRQRSPGRSREPTTWRSSSQLGA